MPTAARIGKAQSCRQTRADRRPLWPHSRQSTRRTRQRHLQHRASHIRQSSPLTQQGAAPTGHQSAKTGGRSRLPVGSPRHRQIRMGTRQGSECLYGTVQPDFPDIEQTLQAQRERSVHDVLRRGPPMQPGRMFGGPCGLGEGLDQGGHWHAVQSGLCGHCAGVDLQFKTCAVQKGGGGFGDYAQLALNLRQGALYQHHRTNFGAVGEQLCRFIVAKKAAIERAVGRAGGHCSGLFRAQAQHLPRLRGGCDGAAVLLAQRHHPAHEGGV